MENAQVIAMLAQLLGTSQVQPSAAPVAAMNSRPPIKIVAGEEGVTVRPYDNNPEYGYIQIEESGIVVRSKSWIGAKRRSALLKGKVAELKTFLRENLKNGILPGIIVIQEFLEEEVPMDLQKEFYGNLDERDYDVATAPYVKKSGTDGVELTSNGQRIMRFSFYDATSQEIDTTIAHDNGADVASHARALRADRAEAMKIELQAKADLAARVEADNVAKVEADNVAKAEKAKVEPVVAEEAILPGSKK